MSYPARAEGLVNRITECVKGHNFPKVISTKVNVMARQKFELSYNDVTVQYISYNATETTIDTDSLTLFYILLS